MTRIPLLIVLLCTTIPLFLTYYAYRLLPLSDIYAISMCSPALVPVLTYWSLRESGITAINIGALIMAMAGALIAIRPAFLFDPYAPLVENDRTLGFMMVITGIIVAIPSHVYTQSLKTIPVSVIGAWQALIVITVCACAMPFVNDKVSMPVDTYTWFILFGQVQGYQSPGWLDLVRCTLIVMGFVWDITNVQDTNCVHLNERKFKCNEENCGKNFRQKSDLIRHKRIHSGEKPFVCNFNDCNKMFTRNTELKIHLRRHMNIKSHKCIHNNCNQQFVSSSALHQHLRYNHI
ncbi:unnamed protein product [Medioppia subpectinata]|uniref:C2H2-type domain-containing protein n=1 Tax=Medioppia subpectinata TaxID=1979941 RepID=A0A7R9KEM2_9ACAR|nr:unnamed protein product [Medioppia subpectinata]CAG2101180.1 unnamed protein product [Medioppia subpectinata]